MKHFFTVGPSQLNANIEKYFKKAMLQNVGSISHRSQAFRDIYKNTDLQLRKLMNIPNTHSIFFMPSASEIWERMITNCVQKKSAHFMNGAFSKKFHEYSQSLGKQTQTFILEDHLGFNDLHKYKIDDDVELICVTLNETSSGAYIQENELVKLKKQHPIKLICADIVSCAPYPKLNFKYLDCAFFSVQKAFGLPAGLGVWIVNDACLEKSKTIKNKSAHHSLENFVKNYATFETPSTPNVLDIFLLGEVATEMNNTGIDAIRKTIEERAKILYDLPLKNKNLEINIANKKNQSQTVVVFNTKIAAQEIIKKLALKNIIIGSGYGAFKTTQIRIGNFPAVSEKAFKSLVKELWNV
jgi:phosphoserine aminotransferase